MRGQQRHRRRGWARAIALFAAGCVSEGAPAAELAEPERSDEAGEAGEAGEDVERAARLDAEGLEARVLDDGRVRVEGTDRWGNPLSVTYADASYFRDALPVLSRSLMPAQADALRSFGDTLAEGAP